MPEFQLNVFILFSFNFAVIWFSIIKLKTVSDLKIFLLKAGSFFDFSLEVDLGTTSLSWFKHQIDYILLWTQVIVSQSLKFIANPGITGPLMSAWKCSYQIFIDQLQSFHVTYIHGIKFYSSWAMCDGVQQNETVTFSGPMTQEKKFVDSKWMVSTYIFSNV